MTNYRILHMASIRWNSAIAEYALSAARALRDLGHTTHLVGLDGAPLLLRAAGHELATTAMGSFSVTQVLRVKAIIDEFKPDVILTHGGPETMLAGLANSGRPLFRVRGYSADAGFFSGLTHDLGQLGVQGIIAPSRAIEETLKKISKIPIKTVPLGIDTMAYQPMEMPDAVTQLGMTPKRPTLLIFGRLDPVKGHREFMRIFKLVLSAWTAPVKPLLRIVGEPANLSLRHLEEFAAEEGLTWNEDIQVACGRVQNVQALLSGVSVGVISSIGSEIICRVAEEFLCCGTPILVSGVGSLDEVLINRKMGMSYGGLSEAEAAQRIAEVLQLYAQETPEQRQDRSKDARTAFSLATMGQRMEGFINEHFA